MADDWASTCLRRLLRQQGLSAAQSEAFIRELHSELSRQTGSDVEPQAAQRSRFRNVVEQVLLGAAGSAAWDALKPGAQELRDLAEKAVAKPKTGSPHSGDGKDDRIQKEPSAADMDILTASLKRLRAIKGLTPLQRSRVLAEEAKMLNDMTRAKVADFLKRNGLPPVD
jgi:hypothetical protein